MIDFSSDEVRNAYHSFPIEAQVEVELMASRLLELGYLIKIEFADNENDNLEKEESLELSIRIDKKFDTRQTVLI